MTFIVDELIILFRQNKKICRFLKRIRKMNASDIKQFIIKQFGQHEFDNMSKINITKYSTPCIATLLFGIYLFVDNWETIYKSRIQTNNMFEAYVAAYSFLLWNAMYFLFDFTDLVKYKYKTSSDPNSINCVN